MKLALLVGHSPRSKGARAVDGQYEYDFHRHTVARVANAVLARGHEFKVFPREPSQREQIAAVNAWGPDLVIEFHFNAMPASHAGQASGTEVLYYPGSKAGRMWAVQLAAAIAGAQGTRLRHENGAKAQAEASEGRGALKLLSDTHAPAVIVETHFGDNAEDHRKATAARNSDAVAQAIAAALP